MLYIYFLEKKQYYSHSNRSSKHKNFPNFFWICYSHSLWNIFSRFFNFLYCLENKQWLLHFSYQLFQIHFPTNFLSQSLSHLNIISSFILYFFHHLFFLYSFPQLYFSIKSIISTTFFAIFSQESYQNLMWKVVTNFNLNPPLKLFFYSPILANNNLLLKIYYENIMVVFLNCLFLFFILFFLP